MLVLLATWLFLWTTTIGLGYGFLKFVSKKLKVESNGLPFSLVFVSGLSISSFIAGVWSCFGAVGSMTQIFILNASWLFIFLHKKDFIEDIKQWKREISWAKSWYIIPFIAFLLCILVYAASAPIVYDTGLYHAQAIQWIQKFGSVPGLGNLHGRFAFNSHTFVLSALFDLSVSNKLGIYVLNSGMFCVFFGRYFGIIIQSLKDHDYLSHFFHLLVLLFGFHFLNPFISSPTADVTVALLFFFVTSWFIKPKSIPLPILVSVALMLSAFAFTIKLSALLIAAIPLLFIFQFKSKQNWWTTTLALSIILIIPFIVRNVLLSGYLIYPISLIDIFNVDWKIPQITVIQEIDAIKSWARIPYKPTKEVLSMTLEEWFPVWWKNLGSSIRVVVIINLIAPILYVISGIRHKFNSWIPFIGFGLTINVLFWFMSAPDFRFAYGALLTNTALCIAFILSAFNRKEVTWVVSGSFILIYLYFVPSHIYSPDYVTARILKPDGLKTIDVKRVEAFNFKYSIPENGDQCYNAEIPCAPNSSKQLVLRGKDLGSGFKAFDYREYNIEARKLNKIPFDKSFQSEYFEVKIFTAERRILIISDRKENFNTRFFLHVFPKSENNEPSPFINADFQVNHVDPPFENMYYHVVELPNTEISGIRIGQFNQDGRLWEKYLPLD